ncbi:MAG: MarR family transcriptional regulator [Candidatus Omnitrophota bacterium]|jgi:MarR family 2-MHQ and catechol resistance regulon transcriptional repressor
MTTPKSALRRKPSQDLLSDYYWPRVRKYGKRYPKFHWPSVELLLNLVYTYEVLSTHFAKRIGRYDLSLSTFNVLMILSQSERGGLKQQDLSRLMLVSRANVTGLVDSLVRRGLVVRGPDAKDRRVCMAKITRKGEELLEHLLPGHYEETARVAGAIGHADKARMNRLFISLRKQIQPGPKEGGVS